MTESTGGDRLRRRDFLKAAVAAAAAGSLSPHRLRAAVMPASQALQVVSLGNGEAPAIQFQGVSGWYGSAHGADVARARRGDLPSDPHRCRAVGGRGPHQ